MNNIANLQYLYQTTTPAVSRQQIRISRNSDERILSKSRFDNKRNKIILKSYTKYFCNFLISRAGHNKKDKIFHQKNKNLFHLI